MNETYKQRNPRGSMYFKQNKHKKLHTKTLYKFHQISDNLDVKKNILKQPQEVTDVKRIKDY